MRKSPHCLCKIFFLLGLCFFAGGAVAAEDMQTRVWSCKTLHDNMMGLSPVNDDLVSGEWVGGREKRNMLFDIKITALKQADKGLKKPGRYSLIVESEELQLSNMFNVNFYYSRQLAYNSSIEKLDWNFIFSAFGVREDEVYLSQASAERRYRIKKATSLFLTKKGKDWQGAISSSRIGEQFDLVTASLQFICKDWNVGR